MDDRVVTITEADNGIGFHLAASLLERGRGILKLIYVWQYKRRCRTMKTKLLSAVLTMVLLALVGCAVTPEPTSEAAKLRFKVEVNMGTDGKAVLRFGVHNTEPADFPGKAGGKWK